MQAGTARTIGAVRLLLLAAVTVALSACAPIEVRSRPGTTTTVILTRHADREPDNPRLNATGDKRAQALVEAVKGMDVTAIYSPNVERNLDTVRPLARALGIEITVTPESSLLFAESIVDEMLSRHAGGVIVWVGNVTGNLMAVYHFLGGTGEGPSAYGELVILTITDNAPVKIDRRRYGP